MVHGFGGGLVDKIDFYAFFGNDLLGDLNYGTDLIQIKFSI